MVGEIGGDEEEKHRRLHRRARHQAGRRLHRRLHRAARQAHGPRRRDHLRLVRAPRRRRPRRSRPRACGSGTNPTEVARHRRRAGRRPSLASSLYPADGLPSTDQLRPRRAEPRHHARRGRCASAPTGVLRDGPGRRPLVRRRARATPPLRDWIAERHGVEPERVLVTNGSLEAGHDAVRPPGRARASAVIVEAPSYDRTLLALRERGAELSRVPLEDDGHRRRRARGRRSSAGATPELRAHDPELPQPGRLHALARPSATRLLELAAEHDFLIFEDDPYGELRFEGEDLPTMLSLRHEPDASSTRARSPRRSRPGVRVGYLIGPPDLIAALTKVAVNTYISPNMLSQAIVCEFCRSGRDRAVDRDGQAQPCASAATRWRRACARTSATTRASCCRRAATSSGSSCPRRSTPRGCCSAAEERGVTFVDGRRLHARGRRQRAAPRLLGRHAGAGDGGRTPARRGAPVPARRRRGLALSARSALCRARAARAARCAAAVTGRPAPRRSRRRCA